MFYQLRSVGLGSPGALAQSLGVLGNDHGQLKAGISALETLGQVPGVEVAVDLGHLVGVGVFPAQLDGGDAPFDIAQVIENYLGIDNLLFVSDNMH